MSLRTALLGPKPVGGRAAATPTGQGLLPPVNPPSPDIAGTPPWAPIGVTPAWVQVGRYGTPIPTQQRGYWPDIQLKNGVMGLVSGWNVAGVGDTPYWQRSTFPANPAQNVMAGGRPGPPLGPAQTAALLGPLRANRRQQLAQLAQGLLGW
jgi:hypothetical protein